MKIEVGEFYTYRNNPSFVAECVARYGDGGVAVQHVKDFQGKPMISTAYLSDVDLVNRRIVEAPRPVRGYVLFVSDDHNGPSISQNVYNSEAAAQRTFNYMLEEKPDLKLIKIKEIRLETTS